MSIEISLFLEINSILFRVFKFNDDPEVFINRNLIFRKPNPQIIFIQHIYFFIIINMLKTTLKQYGIELHYDDIHLTLWIQFNISWMKQQFNGKACL